MDGQLSYWEALDGREIRAVSVGRHGAVTALDVGADGEAVATGGQDSAAKVRARHNLKVDKHNIAFSRYGAIDRATCQSSVARTAVR